jgi:hypothetical protein
MGELFLTSSDPNLMAQLVDDQGRELRAPFAVASREAVSIPAGNYGLRVSAPGLLSETWPFEIERRQTIQQQVHLSPRWLWRPQEINSSQFPETEVVQLKDQANLLVLSHAAMTAEGTRTERRLRLVNGSSGDPVWRRDLVFNDSTLPLPGRSAEWSHLLMPPGAASSFKDTNLSERAQDLNGDGTRDLVLLSRNSPSLLAVSGETGEVLWWFRGDPALPDEMNAASLPDRSRRGSIVGTPAVADVNADGIPDFLACYHVSDQEFQLGNGASFRTGPQNWLGAVCGKTGAELWRQPLKGNWRDYGSSSSDTEQLNQYCRPAMGRIDRQEIVVLLEETLLLGWDARTGTPAWAPIELEFKPNYAPQLADLNGDGYTQALLVRQSTDDEARLELLAFELPSGAERWRRKIASGPPYQHQYFARIEQNFFTLEDLDGDNLPEIILSTGWHSGYNLFGFGLAVLEGSSGLPLWETPLSIWPQIRSYAQTVQFMTGPDIDGDGRRETFAAWETYDSKQGKYFVMLSAFSSGNGKALWRVPLLGSRIHKMGEWKAGADGWPLLLVQVDRHGSSQPMTYFCSSASGRVEQTLSDTQELHPGDFDGDGILDLYYTVSAQGDPPAADCPGNPAGNLAAPERMAPCGGFQSQWGNRLRRV